MMKVGKLCGLAVIVVAIIPIILGMVWPNDTETISVWEVNPGIDATGGLANREISIWDTYTGPMNNLTVYDPNSQYGELTFPHAMVQTDVPNSYPVSLLESTTTASSILIGDIGTTDKARYGIWDNAGFTITGEQGTFRYGDYWPATNTLFLYGPNLTQIKAITPKYTDVIAGNLSVATFYAPLAYIDITKGLQANGQFTWIGSLENRSVDIWIKVSRFINGSYIEIDDIKIFWNGSVAVSDYSDPDNVTTTLLGSAYDWVSVRLTNGTAEIAGLIGVESFVDKDYTEGNKISLDYSGPLNNIPMRGSNTAWWIKSTVSAIGKTTGIKDSVLDPKSYFGVESWQVQIINPSTFGNALVFTKGAEVKSYPITSGTITVTNLATSAQSQEAVRSMRILSLLEDGGQTIYINGIKAIHYANSGDVTVTFSGSWMASVVAAKVVQSQQERYTWNVASFGFDQTSYCTVGMLGCALVAIVGSFWGKKNGESVAALYLTMGLCGIAYLIMIP